MLAKVFTDLIIVSPVPSLLTYLTYQNTIPVGVRATQTIPFNSQSFFFKTLILVTREGASI